MNKIGLEARIDPESILVDGNNWIQRPRFRTLGDYQFSAANASFCGGAKEIFLWGSLCGSLRSRKHRQQHGSNEQRSAL
jgi:hypothetical protein